MKSKILVLGGTGFIGYNFLKKIAKLEFEVDCLSRKIPKKNKVNKINYIACDLTKIENIKRLKKNYDYIFNFSGNIDHSNSVQNNLVHYKSIKQIIKYFLKTKIRLFVQLGSSLEYGNLNSPHKEFFNCKPKSSYGLSKLKVTKLLKKCFKKNKFPYVVLRLYQVYGPHQKNNRFIPYSIISEINKKKYLCTEGIQYRDFIYIDDLLDLLLIFLKLKRIKYGVYNIGSGNPYKVKHVLEMIRTITKKKGTPLFGSIKMRNDEILKLFPDITKVKKNFYWRPKTKLIDGLKKTIKFYEKK